jgi:hypothetical protein
VAIARRHERAPRNGDGGAAIGADEVEGESPQLWRGTPEVDLAAWLSELARAWRMVAAAGVAAFFAAWLIASFAMTRWYRASSIVRPGTAPAVQNQLLGMIGGAVAPAMIAGLGGPQAGDAQEYVTILESFGFTVALVRRHQLAPTLLSRAELNGGEFARSRELQWAAHNAMSARFGCDYSAKTGNLTLSYNDLNPERAQRVLGYYVDGLREKLRQREIDDSSAAVATLQEEVRATSDTLLAQNLYELMAKQLQRKKLAQVQADFAFTVLEAPIASPRAFYPRPLFTSIIAAVLGALAAWAVALVQSRRRRNANEEPVTERDGAPASWS